MDRDENVKYPRRLLNALAHRHSDVAETVAQQAAKKISQESRKHWTDFVANMDGRCTVDIFHKQKEHIAVFQHFNHQHVAISKLKNSYFEIFCKNLSFYNLVGAHEDELMTLRYLQLDYAVDQKAVRPG